MEDWFDRIARKSAEVLGQAPVFISAVVLVLVWLLTGPVFRFNDTWQLIANTGTTIITFLMVFILQNTQNRDNIALHTKLDAILREVTDRVDLESIEDKSMREIKDRRGPKK